jgi:hypothetical protein
MIGLVASGLLAAMASSAHALTVGEVASTEPSANCESFPVPVFLLQTGSSGTSFTVPSAGIVTSWSTSFGKAGAPVSLVVASPNGSKSFTLVGSDSETLPTPIPSSHVSTFTPKSPFLAEAGDVIGLQVPAKSQAACAYETASKLDTFEYGEGHELTPGSTLTTLTGGEKDRINVAVELEQSADLALTQAATPSPAPSGSVALIQFSVTNASGGMLPATVTDAVPAGLPVLAAASTGRGTCTTAGQAVTCELASVSATPTTVDIVVSTPTPGAYTNQGLVTSKLSDPNPSNNVAGTTITVQAPSSPPAPTPSCKVIALGGYPLSLAKLVIPALNCTVGKVTSKASKTVHKGLVISTSPGAGATLAAGSAVNIVTSSGPPKKKKKKKKKH